MSRAVFGGARIFDGVRVQDDAVLLVEEGCVDRIALKSEIEGREIIDLGGGILSPGFVDLQVNGGGGLMLNDQPNLDGIRTICEAHARLGSTGLLPTLITDRPDITKAAISAAIEAARAQVPGFLGLHLEGPHLGPGRPGAHDPALIRPMQSDDLEQLVEAATQLPALLVTLAPEAVTLDQIAALNAAGAIVSIGHSDATAEQAKAAFRAGARMVTHLFNAMSPLRHREPGIVGAALSNGEVFVGLIADGVHVDPDVMRIALAGKQGDDLMVHVTDAMAVAGTDLQEFELQGRRILRQKGRLTLRDGTLAGADCDMTQALSVLTEKVGLDLVDALKMVTVTPAACIGLAGIRGCLVPGAPADLVHLSDDLQLLAVWREGERITV